MPRNPNPTPLSRTWTRRSILAIGGALALGATDRGSVAAGWPRDRGDASAPGYFESDWLADPHWLMDRSDDPTVKVVALTAVEEFAAGHVPGATQVDWPELEVTDTSDPSIARWQGEVEAILTGLGLSPADTVVVYDGGTLWSARLWWILDQLGHADKRILNGGLAAWDAANGAMETGETSVTPATAPYAGTPNAAALAPLDLVVASLEDPTVALVDARTAAKYAAGHIPGAVNIDFPLNAEPEPPKFWKPAGELGAMYAGVSVTPAKLIIPYCQTGVRSAVTYFTLGLIGYPNVRLFTGSWAEWSSHPELPVATGDQP